MWIIVIFPALGADTRRFGGDTEKRSTAFDSALKIHLDRLFFYDGIAPWSMYKKSSNLYYNMRIFLIFQVGELISEDWIVIEKNGQLYSIQD